MGSTATLTQTTQNQKVHSPIVQKLKTLLADNNDIAKGLLTSLNTACDAAKPV